MKCRAFAAIVVLAAASAMNVYAVQPGNVAAVNKAGNIVTESNTVNISRKDGQNNMSGVLTISKYFVRTDYVLTTETHQILICDEADNGQGDWKGFFNVSREKKPAALADAVMGIGLKTADCIVDNNLLTSKPRSWNAFSAVMKQVDNVCAGAVYYNTVVKYGDTNARNLGYAGTGVCQYQTVTETVLMPVEQKELIESERRVFNISVNGGKLLPTETDNFSVNYDAAGINIRPASGNVNKYDTTYLRDLTVEMRATRMLVTPIINLNVSNAGSELALTNKDYAAGYDPAATAYVMVETVKDGFVNSKLGEKEYKLENGSVSIPLAELINDVPYGKKYFFKFTLRYTNSEYFNSNSSQKQISDKFKK